MEPNIFLDLFLVFFQVGLLAIGGGYAAIPIIENLVVSKHCWLTGPEFNEMLTISEMTPGPITLNVSTFVGEQQAGIPGALVATFSCILPSIIIVSAVAFVYFKFSKIKLLQGTLKQLRPVIIGLIASSSLSITFTAMFGDKTNVSLSVGVVCCMTLLVLCAGMLSVPELRATRTSAIMSISGIGLCASACIACISYSFIKGLSYINISVLDLWSVGIFALCLVLLRSKTFRVNPIMILLFAGSIGLCVAYVPYLWA